MLILWLLGFCGLKSGIQSEVFYTYMDYDGELIFLVMHYSLLVFFSDESWSKALIYYHCCYCEQYTIFEQSGLTPYEVIDR